MNFKSPTLLAFIGLAFFSFLSPNLAQTPLELALRFVEENHQDWKLSKADIKELQLVDQYQSRNGISHIYLQQQFRGINIHNALINISVSPQGTVFTIGQPRLIQNLKNKATAHRPSIQAEAAILHALSNTKINPDNYQGKTPNLKEKISEQAFLFHKDNLSGQDIPAKLEYYAQRDGNLILCWAITIQETQNNDWWNLHINAHNGNLVNKFNHTLYCTFDHKQESETCSAKHKPATKANSSPALAKQEASPKKIIETDLALPNTYRVFPFPGESPNHTTHQIVDNPADAQASPFGWHDTDGMAGPEYTITRGNNVHAYADPLNQNFPQGGEPDGGTDLEFDFPYAEQASVEQNRDAATVNLFYAVNSLHDFFYHYGFDEAAGNFQAKNYSGTGEEGDYIWAHAQDGYLVDSVNNANFSAPADGQIGRMQMYMWNRNVGGGSKYLQVLEPAAVAGAYGGIASSDDNIGFGPAPPMTPITAEVIEAKDGKFNPYTTDACEDILNGDELQGKIALVDRGGCTYESKVIRAEAAGAVAVIICNFQEDPVLMEGTADPDPNIPAIMIGSIDCQTIRQHIATGLTVSIGQPNNTGPDYIDGDFDNGIIAHEFAHGISLRLTGGPSNSGCLANSDFNNNGIVDDTEQMGEGWSDFFALATTAKSGDSGTLRRGIGTYINRQNTDARGIRRYPYSTDMSINPLTYGDVAGDPETHRLGEIWASVLWDFFWAMVDEYNFDSDLIQGTGGNNKAIELAVESIKMLPCQPGFVDAREALIKADLAINGGANECLIWSVFARRGIGFYADQGDPLDPGDQVQNFEPKPTCIPELKIAKEVTPTVEAGENIFVTVTVTNHKPGAATNVVVSEELPDGLFFISSSSNFPADVQNDLVLFELGTLATNEEKILTYQLGTAPDKASTRLLYLDCEGIGDWFTEQPVENNFNKWANSGQTVHSGSSAWRVRAIGAESRQSVFMEFPFTVTVQKPVVRFFHSYLTEGGQDAGIVQISTDENAEEWTDLSDAFLRNGYTGPVNYLTFVIPNLYGFSGNSDGFQASYIDLSAYSGEDIRLRYNFATSEGNGINAPNNGFWAFDDVEFLDLLNYDTEVIAQSEEGDEVRASAGNLGTVVLGGPMATTTAEDLSIQLNLFPNPAQDQVQITIQSEQSNQVDLRLLNLTGQELLQQNIKTDQTLQTINLDLKNFTSGIYFIKAATQEGTIVKKLILKKQ